MSKNIETKTPAAYTVLCVAIGEAITRAGIVLKEQTTVIDGHQGNKNWACFERVDNGHKLYVERTVGDSIIHTTVELDPATPGFIDHKGKAPGKIASYFKADLELVVRYLIPLFVAAESPLRANKAPVRKVKTDDLVTDIKS